MSTTTTNLGLIKPELTDAADITAMNGNWDTLDRVIKENKDEAKAYTDKKLGDISTPDVSGQLNTHNTDGSAHNDIRQLIAEAAATAGGKADKNHSHTASDVGALPIDGSKPMTGALWLRAYLGKLSALSNSTVLENFRSSSDANNKVALEISSNYALEDAIKLEKVVSGVASTYKIFGEHNIDSLASALGAGRIQTGSYTGTGTSGSTNPCTLTCNFEPKFVVIMPTQFNGQNYSSIFAVRNTNGVRLGYSNTVQTAGTFTWSGNTVSWYETDSKYQCNYKDFVYNWIAIG